MRLFLTTSYPSRPGDASGHFVQAEARASARSGDSVWVLAPGPVESEATEALEVTALPHLGLFGWPGAQTRLRQAPVRLIGLPLMMAAASAAAIPKLAGVREIVAHWLVPCGWPLGMFLRRFNKSLTLTVVAHGSDVRLLGRHPRLGRLVVESLARSRTELRCVSSELVGDLRLLASTPSCERWLDEARVEPIEIDLGAARRLERQTAREQLGIDGRLVLIVGRLVVGKRVGTALEAARLLDDCQVVVVGSGPEQTRLERDFPEARFLGQLPRDQTLHWIAAADLVLSASRIEGAPTAIREARALGTPVVTVEAGDLKRWSQSDPELWVVG